MKSWLAAVVLVCLVAAAVALEIWAKRRGTPSGIDLAAVVLGGIALVGLLIRLGRFFADRS